jgi:hypothetical protein
MSEPRVTRRNFAGNLAVGGGLALVPWAADDVAAQQRSPINGEDGPQPEAGPAIEDLRLAALVQQYPSGHLTGEMLVGIRAGLQRNRQQAAELRKVPLKNSDAPAFVFAAWRAPQNP